jgi:ankyrin repeat protein
MEILQLLVNDPRTDVNIRDVKEDAPLHYALELNCLRAVQILIRCPRLKANQQDYWKNTPLHKAAILNLSECVEIILSHPGVNLLIENADGVRLILMIHPIRLHCRHRQRKLSI